MHIVLIGAKTYKKCVKSQKTEPVYVMKNNWRVESRIDLPSYNGDVDVDKPRGDM